MKNLGKEILFRLITLSLPLLLLVLVELILRLAGVGENVDLFVENPAEGFEQYMMVNPVVGKKYFQKFEYTSPPNDIFLREKAPESFRIFVMGSSTVVGFPHGYNLMFSRILHQQLQDAYPGRHIEVVNTAITAINSFTLYDYARQIARHEPDAVLIYAGHNEFYGAFGAGSNERMSKSTALTRLNFLFMDLRFFQALKNAQGKRALRKQQEVRGTLMKRMVGNPDIPFGSEPYEGAMESYRRNMGDVLKRFGREGVPVFFSEVVSNVKDLPPFSEVGRTAPGEAGQAFARGQEALQKGDLTQARILLEKARDLDGIRFRASTELNELIRELSKREGARLVSMQAHFEAHAPGGIIGKELMTEHVHPNIDGAFLMAEAFMQALLEEEVLGSPAGKARYPRSYYQANWGCTELDSLLAHHRIANLETHWPFQALDAPLPDYRKTYRPRNLLDSLAFLAMADTAYSLTDLRLELAREYERKGQWELAYGEYEAILRTNPYLAVNYRDAAAALIMLGDLPLARAYFEHSLEIRPSFFARYRLGEIAIIQGDYARARAHFQQAFNLATQEEDRLKAMGKLYQACVYGGQGSDARRLAEQLKQYQAERYMQLLPPVYTFTRYIPFQTKEEVVQARELMNAAAYEAASELLLASLERYDSHMARRYLLECYVHLDMLQEAREQLQRVEAEFAFDKEFKTWVDSRLN